MTTSVQEYTPTLSQRLFHSFYSITLSLLVLFALFIFLARSLLNDSRYRKRKLQRFGFLPKINQQGGILLHCVSVGEVVAASTIVKRIQKRHPEYPITITTTTQTGADRVEQIFGSSVSHLFLPYDLSISMKTLLNRIKPEKVLITEVELWPNLIDVCWKRKIPVFIVNARLTDKSAKSYAKLSYLFAPMLHKVHGVCAQGERDYNNYKMMAIPKDKLILTNNIKFDQPLTQSDLDKANAITQQLNIVNRPVLLGASTHAPEEETLLESYRSLKERCPELLLVLTPRHPERFQKVEKLVADAAMNLQKYSSGQSVNTDTDVVLVDAMGILKSLYSIATFAFVGGSIADRGGHNALEAALFSKPILMGPHTYNNPVICQTLIDAGALSIVQNSSELAEKVTIWLAQPEDAATAGEAGLTVLRDNAGAITKTLNVIGIDA